MQVAKPIIKKGHIARKSRGYSLQKLLQEISLSSKVARKNSRSVDVLGQTKHSENVEQLKPIQKAIEMKHREKPANKQ
jgi:ribosomal protein L13E